MKVRVMDGTCSMAELIGLSYYDIQSMTIETFNSKLNQLLSECHSHVTSSVFKRVIFNSTMHEAWTKAHEKLLQLGFVQIDKYIGYKDHEVITYIKDVNVKCAGDCCPSFFISSHEKFYNNLKNAITIKSGEIEKYNSLPSSKKGEVKWLAIEDINFDCSIPKLENIKNKTEFLM